MRGRMLRMHAPHLEPCTDSKLPQPCPSWCQAAVGACTPHTSKHACHVPLRCPSRVRLRSWVKGSRPGGPEVAAEGACMPHIWRYA